MFISQLCRFALLLPGDISKQKRADGVRERDAADCLDGALFLRWCGLYRLTGRLRVGVGGIAIHDVAGECTVCVRLLSFCSPLRMEDHSFALIASHDNIIRRKASQGWLAR